MHFGVFLYRFGFVTVLEMCNFVNLEMSLLSWGSGLRAVGLVGSVWSRESFWRNLESILVLSSEGLIKHPLPESKLLPPAQLTAMLFRRRCDLNHRTWSTAIKKNHRGHTLIVNMKSWDAFLMLHTECLAFGLGSWVVFFVFNSPLRATWLIPSVRT